VYIHIYRLLICRVPSRRQNESILVTIHIYMCIYNIYRSLIRTANPYSFPQVPYTSPDPVPSVSSVPSVSTCYYVYIWVYIHIYRLLICTAAYRLLICTAASHRSPTPRPTQFRQFRWLLLSISMCVYTYIQVANPYSPFPD